MKQWLKNAVFYHIYPQSFNDTNGDGIGDFDGIIEKLDYIQDIGFTDIWMNPCWDSPFNDGGYDVRDYYKTADRYGSNQDLKRLIDEMHRRGMHLLLDFIPGHTSVENEWFKQSAKAERNRYTDRFVWTDSNRTGIYNVTGVNGFLRGYSERDGCCATNYYSSQPALNYGFAKVTEPWQFSVDSEAALETRKAIMDVMRFWLRLGCDGFRVDMAGGLVKNDEDGMATAHLWSQIFEKMNQEFPEAAYIAEWGEPNKAIAGGFDMDFLLNYGHSHYWDAFHSPDPYFSDEVTCTLKDFFAYYMDSYKTTYGKGLICMPSGHQDMTRTAKFCNPLQIKLSFAFMMSMPGAPFVYYGDEIGMRYLEDIPSVEGGYERTGSRTPMQWDHTVNDGFSVAGPDKLYNKMDPDPDRPTVADQLADEHSILNELKRQIAVRKQHEVLQSEAKLEVLHDGYPLVFTRSVDKEAMLIVINPTKYEQSVEIGAVKTGDVVYALGEPAKTENGKVAAPPHSATYLWIQ